ncbi:MAG: HAD-IC family P-type ATPase, partial [Saccharopolyspora sp.]|uniref:HAD-IC family P-type ATPase n=1 Tax=Saccharopolyspora sp. TaxID=33915 RepID=UPI0025F06FB7
MQGIADPDKAELVEQVADRLRALAGVRWVEVNAALGCLVVGHDEAVIEAAELVSEVDDSVELVGLTGYFAETSVAHPDSPGRTLGHVAVIGANLTGLGYAAVARALPVPSLPKSVPALLSTAGATPKIWDVVQSRLGSAATDLLFGVGSAVAHTFAQEPTSLLMEAGLRLSALRETQSSQRSWERWQEEFAQDPQRYRCAAEPLPPRPVALPAGPVERTGDVSAAAAPAGFASALGLSGNLARAEGFLVAATPRAAGMGREAFATQLGHALAERDIFALDPGALRRLDRIDTVVVDADALLTGNRIVHDVIALDEDSDAVELWQQANELVVRGRRELAENDDQRRDWTIEAWGTRSRWPAGLRDRLSEAADTGARICMLRRGATQAAVVVIVDELEPLVDQLLAAARAAGSLVLAGGGRRLGARLGVEQVVAGGSRLAGSVRALQAQGAGVALVSARGYAGLTAADIGLGAVTRDKPAPWGAHIFCRPGLGGCCVVLRLLHEAHQASLRCSRISAGASLAGGVLVMLGPAGTSQQRAGIPVTVAAAMALGMGTLWGFQAGQRPVPRAASRTAWHSMSPAQALEMLGSSAAGLGADEISRRFEDQQQVGGRPVGLLGATLSELDSPLTPALAGGAGISASIGALTDAAVIGAVLCMNALLGGVQRVRADRALSRLMESSAVSVTAIRDGGQQQVVSDELVVGDIIELVAGDSVPADCRVLEADGLQVDESSLTGESQLVDKDERATPAVALADRTSMIYQGTAVAAGRALGLVVATGPDTEAKRTLSAADAQPRAGGVAARLNSLAKSTTPLCIGAGGLLLAVDLVRSQPVGTAVGRAVSLAVAAVPEGLPVVATMAEL